MNTLRITLLSMACAILGFAAQAQSSINAPLTEEHYNYVFNHAPFLVQPKCDSSEHIPCLVDQDDDDPTNNGSMSEKFTINTPASIDFDLVSTGMVDLLIYQFNRPSSSHYGYDGEPVVVFMKRDKVADIYKEKFDLAKSEVVAVRTNAHGGAPDLAGATKYANVIGPNYAKSFTSWGMNLISSEARTQLSSNNRVAAFLSEKSDNSISHPVVLSDDKNALIPVSDLAHLGGEYDGAKTVIFFPVMGKKGEANYREADTAELKKNFPSAQFRPYNINKREWSRNALRLHGLKEDFFANAFKSSTRPFTTFSQTKVETIAGIGSDARIDKDGKESGANFWHGWTNIAVKDNGKGVVVAVRRDGTEVSPPKNYKDGLDRIPLIYTQEIVERTFNNLLTADEIKAGGSLVVRNGFMKDVK